jgi:SAM-dependent methyltransferase
VEERLGVKVSSSLPFAAVTFKMTRMDYCPACGGGDTTPSWIGEGRFEGRSFSYVCCLDCGTVFVYPMPSAAQLDRMYGPEYVAAHYSETTSPELGREAEVVADKIVSLRPRPRVLDIGCGAGAFLVKLRQRGATVVGYEPVPATAADTARATGLDVRSGPLAELIRAGPFDVIHLADVLEHVPKPIDVLETAARLSSPSGVVVVRGPLEAQACLFLALLRTRRQLLRSIGRDRPSDVPPWHVTQFTLKGWHRLAARASLRIVWEVMTEVRWPAPDPPRLFSPLSVVREISRTISALPVARRRFGNRVVSVLRR